MATWKIPTYKLSALNWYLVENNHINNVYNNNFHLIRGFPKLNLSWIDLIELNELILMNSKY